MFVHTIRMCMHDTHLPHQGTEALLSRASTLLTLPPLSPPSRPPPMLSVSCPDRDVSCMRRRVLQEVVDTEATYVSGIETMLMHFKVPLVTSKVISLEVSCVCCHPNLPLHSEQHHSLHTLGHSVFCHVFVRSVILIKAYFGLT